MLYNWHVSCAGFAAAKHGIDFQPKWWGGTPFLVGLGAEICRRKILFLDFFAQPKGFRRLGRLYYAGVYAGAAHVCVFDSGRVQIASLKEIANIAMNPEGILHADEIIKTLDVTRAAPNWYVSGIIFPAMGCIMIAPFLARIAITANSSTEAKVGGLVGGLAFGIAACIMSFGIMASIDELYSKNVPALFIAREMFPAVGIVFSMILFAGIYTTAVPMLWLSCNALITDEKSKAFRILAFILTIFAFIGGQFSFARLVNVLYPITGYLGVFLLICMAIKQVTSRLGREDHSLRL